MTEKQYPCPLDDGFANHRWQGLHENCPYRDGKVQQADLLKDLAKFIDESEDLFDTQTHGKAVLVGRLVEWMMTKGFEP